MQSLTLDKLIFAFILLLTLVGFDAQGQTRSLPDFNSLMKAAGPSVVNVISTRKAQTAAAAGGSAPAANDPLSEFYRRFAPDAPERAPARQGLGSGFIVSADGYILTNAHVVAEFDDVTVRLADAKREFKAKVVGVDKRSDVALIKVDAADLPIARLGRHFADAQLERPLLSFAPDAQMRQAARRARGHETRQLARVVDRLAVPFEHHVAHARAGTLRRAALLEAHDRRAAGGLQAEGARQLLCHRLHADADAAARHLAPLLELARDVHRHLDRDGE